MKNAKKPKTTTKTNKQTNKQTNKNKIDQKNIKQQNKQEYQSSHSLPVHFVPSPSNPEQHLQKKDP